MAMLSNESADQSYLDNYFLYRRPKEIQRMIIGVLGLLMGASVMLFAEQITVFLNVSENLNLSEGLVSTSGLIVNLAGVGILFLWILDGKEYVFPIKEAG
tara:strand:+ start:2887 stop:3186 length:300 start_codon:yes stop_codon:yes gene_type:complete